MIEFDWHCGDITRATTIRSMKGIDVLSESTLVSRRPRRWMHGRGRRCCLNRDAGLHLCVYVTSSHDNAVRCFRSLHRTQFRYLPGHLGAVRLEQADPGEVGHSSAVGIDSHRIGIFHAEADMVCQIGLDVVDRRVDRQILRTHRHEQAHMPIRQAARGVAVERLVSSILCIIVMVSANIGTFDRSSARLLTRRINCPSLLFSPISALTPTLRLVSGLSVRCRS